MTRRGVCFADEEFKIGELMPIQLWASACVSATLVLVMAFFMRRALPYGIQVTLPTSVAVYLDPKPTTCQPESLGKKPES